MSGCQLPLWVVSPPHPRLESYPSVVARSQPREMPNPPPPNATWTTRVEPGRGRCLVAATDLPAGAIALAEAPIVWWVDARAQGAVCTHCLKPIVAGSGISCASGQAHWCGADCAAADAERHGRVRELLAPVTKLRDSDPEWTRLTPDERDEAVTLLHLVAHAVALRAADDPAFTLLWDSERRFE